MNSRKEIDDFVAQSTLALVGILRRPGSSSAVATKELKAKGYRLFPVNQAGTELGGERRYATLSAMPEPVGGALLMTPRKTTAEALREAAAAGITRLRIQHGAESEEALARCREQRLSTVSEHCIQMFTEPVQSEHKVHRWPKNLCGGVPR